MKSHDHTHYLIANLPADCWRDVRTGECRAKLQPCGITFTPSVLSRKTWIVGPFFGSPSHLGIAVLIIPSGSFFHAQTNVSVDITEELSPNVRMIPFFVIKIISFRSLVKCQTGGKWDPRSLSKTITNMFSCSIWAKSYDFFVR